VTIEKSLMSINLFAKSDFFNYDDFGGNSGDYRASMSVIAMGHFAVLPRGFAGSWTMLSRFPARPFEIR
jgi:hypothetical protein